MTGAGDDGTMDVELRETERQLRQALRPGQLRPAFQDRLRAELVAAASARPRIKSMPRAVERALRWALAGTAAAILVASIVTVESHPLPAVPVAAASDVDGAVSADPATPVRVRFSQPVDRTATANAVRLTPATQVRTTWQGDVLTIVPLHGFAPNAAYVLTIARNVARTVSGTAFANDLHLVFGTAATARPGNTTHPPVALARTRMAAVEDGSEAAVTRDDSLLLTAARPSPATGNLAGLVRLRGGTASRLGAATDAICVSRSGNSVAFVSRGPGTRSEIVFADSSGNPRGRVPAPVDDGSPLGWIGDSEVSFVSGGKLVALNRAGVLRSLPAGSLNAAQDGLVLSPGGRYAYVHPDGQTGRLVDLDTGTSHPLPGIDGDPAFSADGATVAWLDRSTTVRLASMASAGGPVLTAPLPVSPADRISDLSVSPDGTRLTYTLTHTDGTAQIRLAALPDGRTLGSTNGPGTSPNWSPTSRSFTVLTPRTGGADIDLITVPPATDRPATAFEALATRLANAQISADPEAQQALTRPGTILPVLPPITRAALLSTNQTGNTTATAQIRLTRDARADNPAVSILETVTLTTDPRTGTVQASKVEAGPPTAIQPGPELSRIDTETLPGSALLTFDTDLDPATITAATLRTPNGQNIPATTRYDTTTRTVTIQPNHPTPGPALLTIDTSLHTYDNQPNLTPTTTPITLSPR